MDKMTNAKALTYVLKNTTLPAEVTEKLQKILETASRKASGTKKPSERDNRNDEIQRAVIEEMRANPTKLYTISELERLPEITPEDEMTNQRMNSLVTQLLAEYGDGKTGTGEVRRIKDKRKTYFQYAGGEV